MNEKGIFKTTKWISNHQSITGFATLAGTVLGLVAALRSDDGWMRGTGAALAIFAGTILLYNYRLHIIQTTRWLTLKFIFGMCAGAVVAAVLYAPVSNMLGQSMQRQGKMFIIYTDPKGGSTLSSVYDGLMFSSPKT